jgi:hypothetical protein
MLKSMWKTNCVLFYVKTKPLKIKWSVNFKELVKVTVLIENATNSIFDSFRTDIGDRQGFLDEVARWETRWNMVDVQKPQTLLETLNATNLRSLDAEDTGIIMNTVKIA